MDYKKLINGFKSKEKRIENLIFLLVILIITLLIINSILNKDEENNIIETTTKDVNVSQVSLDNTSLSYTNIELEEKVEEILSKLKGVTNVYVLITYSESEEIVQIYNENNSKSETEEGEGENKKIIKEESVTKDVILDNSSNVLTKKKISPKIEGAIIIAKGAEDINVKTNIVSAVEAITGLASHKIQVFEMGDD